jgi:hypothetical protein
MPQQPQQQIPDIFALVDAVAQRVATILVDQKAAGTHQEWYTAREAATYLRCSVPHLEVLRAKGGGPRFSVVGGKSIRYRRPWLDAYQVKPKRKPK